MSNFKAYSLSILTLSGLGGILFLFTILPWICMTVFFGLAALFMIWFYAQFFKSMSRQL